MSPPRNKGLPRLCRDASVKYDQRRQVESTQCRRTATDRNGQIWIFHIDQSRNKRDSWKASEPCINPNIFWPNMIRCFCSQTSQRGKWCESCMRDCSESETDSYLVRGIIRSHLTNCFRQYFSSTIVVLTISFIACFSLTLGQAFQ